MNRQKSTIEELDAFLSLDKLFYKEKEKTEELSEKFIKDAFAYHINNNNYYRKYCETLGLGIDDVTRDYRQIPMLPSSLFKKNDNYTLSSRDSSILKTSSSGTKGTISVVNRDNKTLQRFFASVAAGVQDVLNLEQSDLKVFSLSPPEDEIEHLWVSYVLAGIAVYYPSKYYISNGVYHVEDVIIDLEKMNESTDVASIIVGSPPLILDTVMYLEEKGVLNLGANAKVITIGGWKSRQGEYIERLEFDERVVKAFGLENTENVRDVYNMVELNTVIFECRHHRKHCHHGYM